MKRIKSTLDFILSAVILMLLVAGILYAAFGGSRTACAASTEPRSLIAGAAR